MLDDRVIVKVKRQPNGLFLYAATKGIEFLGMGLTQKYSFDRINRIFTSSGLIFHDVSEVLEF